LGDSKQAKRLKRKAGGMTKADPNGAALVFLQAIRLDPNCPSVYEALSYALLFARRHEEGVIAGRMGIQKADVGVQSARAYYNTGLNLEKLQRYAEARAAYQNSLLHREHSEVRRHLNNLPSF